MGTVLKTIGTIGRDYSTITAWESDLDNVAVYAAADLAVGECYNDAAFDESVTINGGGTVGLASVTLSVAAGQRHGGTAGVGARIVRGTGNHTMIISVASSATIARAVSWLEINCAGVSNVGAFVSALDGGQVDHCLLHSGVGVGGFVPTGIDTQAIGAGEVLRIFDNFIWNLNYADLTNTPTGIVFFPRNPSYCYNNTIHNVRHSLGSGTGGARCLTVAENRSDAILRNNLCTAPSVVGGTGVPLCFSIPGTTVDDANNASSDGTADDGGGPGALINLVTADQYVSTVLGSEDLHLKAGSNCIDAGTDLGTTPTGVNIDIDGRDRDAKLDTWDIGADEFVGAVAAAARFPAAGTIAVSGPRATRLVDAGLAGVVSRSGAASGTLRRKRTGD